MGNEASIPLALQGSIKDTFQVQVNLKVEFISVGTENSDEQNVLDHIDCMGVLGLKSTEYLGSLSIGFPEATFFKVIESLFGEPCTKITTENADAVSEILNIVYASARKKINEAGFDFQPSIPTTIKGKDLCMALGANGKALKFRCKTESGPFVVSINLRKTGAQSAKS